MWAAFAATERVDKGVFETLRNIYRNFSEADAQRIKDIESVTNHDVKAVEYFLKEEFDKLGGMETIRSSSISAWLHKISITRLFLCL